MSLCGQAVTAMVQQAMHYIDETPDIETRIELIKTLNNVSAGKVKFTVRFQLFKLHLSICSLWLYYNTSVML